MASLPARPSGAAASLLLAAARLAVALLAPSCVDDPSPTPEPSVEAGRGADGADGASDGVPVDPLDAGGPVPVCPDTPIAWLFEEADPYTGVTGAAQLLAAAGFEVRPLPLDRSPAELRGLLVLGAFVSESPLYKAYMAAYAGELHHFVDRSNVLLQLAQADQTEAIPPFLPGGKKVRRIDEDASRLLVTSPAHPLLAGVDVRDGALAWEGDYLGWELFHEPMGFELVLAADSEATRPALLEGSYGRGRILLAAMAPEKPLGSGPSTVPFRTPIGPPAARDAFNAAFFANLRAHTQRVCARTAPPPRLPPSRIETLFAPDSFVLALLPDTQYYSLLYPGVFVAQTAFIARNARRFNIPYVLHLGDIVDTNSPDEWRLAREAMALLDGVVPYALATGNHDYGPGGTAS
jgi:hypothetical protein